MQTKACNLFATAFTQKTNRFGEKNAAVLSGI